MTAPNLMGTFQHVDAEDPALDRENPAFDLKGWEERGDAACLPCKPGQRPAIFTVRHLSFRARARIGDELVKGERQGVFAAVRLALAKVDGGTTMEEVKLEGLVDDDLPALTDKTLDALLWAGGKAYGELERAAAGGGHWLGRLFGRIIDGGRLSPK